MKKLLAVVLSAAMVLGMGTMAFAGETTEAPATDAPATEVPATDAPATEAPTQDPGVVAEISLSVDGNAVVVNIDKAGWNTFPKTELTWDENVEAKVELVTDYAMAVTAGTGTGSLASNPANKGTAKGGFNCSAAYTEDNGDGCTYAGPAYRITFAENAKVEVTLGDQKVTIGATPATDAPATDAPATDAPSKTDEPKNTVEPKKTTAPTTTTTTNKGTSTTASTTKAAKTADAAPVAAMAVLALAAAAVVVGMKKKVTE